MSLTDDFKNKQLKFGWYWIRNNKRGIVPDQYLPNGWLVSNMQSVEEVLAPCDFEEVQKLKNKLNKCKETLEFYRIPFHQLSPVYNIAQHHRRAEKTLEEIGDD